MKACNFAMDEKLWAHAMLIASSIDKDMWKAAVSEFLKSELGRSPDASQLHNGEPYTGLVNGLESLRVAYSMYSGQGAACGGFSCSYLISTDLIQFSPGTVTAECTFEKPTNSWTIPRYSRHCKLCCFYDHRAFRVPFKVA
jgi:hypothetical protein